MLQKLWFHTLKPMVSLPKTYVFAAQKHRFLLHTSDLFVQENSTFFVIIY